MNEECASWNGTSVRKKQEVSGFGIMAALKSEIRGTGCKGGPKVRASFQITYKTRADWAQNTFW